MLCLRAHQSRFQQSAQPSLQIGYFIARAWSSSSALKSSHRPPFDAWSLRPICIRVMCPEGTRHVVVHCLREKSGKALRWMRTTPTWPCSSPDARTCCAMASVFRARRRLRSDSASVMILSACLPFVSVSHVDSDVYSVEAWLPSRQRDQISWKRYVEQSLWSERPSYKTVSRGFLLF